MFINSARHALRRHPKVTTVGATPALFMRSKVANAASGSRPLTCASMSAVYVNAFAGSVVSSASASANTRAAAAARSPGSAARAAAVISPTYVRPDRGTPAATMSRWSSSARAGASDEAHAEMSVLYVMVSGEDAASSGRARARAPGRFSSSSSPPSLAPSPRLALRPYGAASPAPRGDARMDSYSANARSARPAAAYNAMAALRTATVPETDAGAVSNASSASSASGEAAANDAPRGPPPRSSASSVSLSPEKTSSDASASSSSPRQSPRRSRGCPRHAVSADASV